MAHKDYFTGLNYTLGNEDTALEFAVLPEECSHVVAAAGSGSRIVPLLAKFPKRITCVDISPEQLYLTELRVQTLKALTYSEFLSFWGYSTADNNDKAREKLFSLLTLSDDAADYWQHRFQHNNWESPLYQGKWERTFIKLSKINSLVTGRSGKQLFEYDEMSSYKRYYEHSFPKKRWSLLVRILGNAKVFNALLYRGEFPRKNTADSTYQFYVKAFDRLFKQDLSRKNFFLQLLFFGEIKYSDGYPLECRVDIFSKAKKHLERTEIVYVPGDIIAVLRQQTIPVDFVSFSDAPSYFEAETARTFLEEIRENLALNAIVAIRYYMNVLTDKNTKGFEDITSEYRQEIDDEKVQMYQIEILKRTT